MKYNFYPFNYKRFCIIRNNKVVIKTKGLPIPPVLNDPTSPIYETLQYMEEGHYCGYVAFPKWKIPMKWWGDYSSEGLQYLNIHGGITYASIDTNSKIRRNIMYILQSYNNRIKNWYVKKYNIKIDLLPITEVLDTSESWKQKTILKKLKRFDFFEVERFFKNVDKIIGGVFGDVVVFGFDCAHSGDEFNENLKDHKIVMLLVEQMERQLLDYARVIKKWRRSIREDKITIIDKIRGGEKFKTEIGFGAMIDVLSGGSSLGKNTKEQEVKTIKRMWKK